MLIQRVGASYPTELKGVARRKLHGEQMSLFAGRRRRTPNPLGTYRILYALTNATRVAPSLSDTIAIWAALGRVIRTVGSRSFGGDKPVAWIALCSVVFQLSSESTI